MFVTDGLIKRAFRLTVVLLGLWLVWDLLSHLVAEVLWFQEVGYLPAFLERLKTQLVLWAIASSTSASFLASNLVLAKRLKYPAEFPQMAVGNRESVKQAELGLRSLLPAVLLLSLLVGLMLLHYGKIAFSLWHPDFSLPSVTPPLPLPFGWASLKPLLVQHSWQDISWQLGVVVAITIALVVKPQFCLSAIACALSLFFGLVLSGHWDRILQYLHPTAFNAKDPLFGQDISFHIFSLPVWQLLDFWLGGLFLFGLVAVALIYLLSGDSFSQGNFLGFSQNQLRHLYGLGTPVAMLIAVHYWLSRYELLYSTLGVAYGASYTAVKAQLPVNTGLSILAGAIAISMLVQTIFWFRYPKRTGNAALRALGLYLAVVGIAGGVVPAAVQRFAVEPNELGRERPYIERSIALTRAAFDLENIEVKTFDPQGQLTFADLQANDLTIRNIRLWDKRPLLQTNRQLQQIRLYYQFPDADIARYTLKVNTPRGTASSNNNVAPNSSQTPDPNPKSKIQNPKSKIPLIPRGGSDFPNPQYRKATSHHRCS